MPHGGKPVLSAGVPEGNGGGVSEAGIRGGGGGIGCISKLHTAIWGR